MFRRESNKNDGNVLDPNRSIQNVSKRKIFPAYLPIDTFVVVVVEFILSCYVIIISFGFFYFAYDVWLIDWLIDGCDELTLSSSISKLINPYQISNDLFGCNSILFGLVFHSFCLQTSSDLA